MVAIGANLSAPVADGDVRHLHGLRSPLGGWSSLPGRRLMVWSSRRSHCSCTEHDGPARLFYARALRFPYIGLYLIM